MKNKRIYIQKTGPLEGRYNTNDNPAEKHYVQGCEIQPDGTLIEDGHVHYTAFDDKGGLRCLTRDEALAFTAGANYEAGWRAGDQFNGEFVVVGPTL
jgi:hypothetical protein